MAQLAPLEGSDEDQVELERRLRSTTAAQGDVTRARIVLACPRRLVQPRHRGRRRDALQPSGGVAAALRRAGPGRTGGRAPARSSVDLRPRRRPAVGEDGHRSTAGSSSRGIAGATSTPVNLQQAMPQRK